MFGVDAKCSELNPFFCNTIKLTESVPVIQNGIAVTHSRLEDKLIMTGEKGSWGGARPGAGNPEFKPKWKSGKTTVIRVPEAIADKVLTAARRIDQGEALDSVTLKGQGVRSQYENVTQLKDTDEAVLLKAANKELCQKVGSLEASLFKAMSELQRTAKERDEYSDQISEIQLELDNLRDETVTKSSETRSPTIEVSTLFNQLRPLLNRLNDRERRAILLKLEEIFN